MLKLILITVKHASVETDYYLSHRYQILRVCHSRDHMVVGFTTTYRCNQYLLPLKL
jgi:hypothetical protein